MARSNRSPSRRGGSDGAAPPERTLRWMGGVLAVVCLVSAAAVFGLARLWTAIRGMDEFRVRPGRDTPIASPWIRSDAFRRHLQDRDASGVLRGEYSIFESQLSERVARALACSPYTRSVRSVSRVFPNRLQIAVEWREPSAIVQSAQTGRCYCVDEDGVVLSPALYWLTPENMARLLPMVIVEGTRAAPVEGQVWREDAVFEGIAMLRLVREQFGSDISFQSIQVQSPRHSSSDGTVVAWLNVTGGPRVFWGRTPAARPSAVEPSTETKVAAFRAVWKKAGAGAAALKVIDLHLPQPRLE